MKRILIFSNDDHLYPAGGAEQAFGNITERLPEIEFDLICARLRRSALRHEQVKNIMIHRLGFGIPKVDGFILALFGHLYAYRLMKTKKYSLVWSIMATYGAFSAVRVKKKTGLPFVLTLQEGDSFDYIYRKVRYVRKQFNEIFETADAVQAISSYLLNWAKEMGFVGKIGLVIPNGVRIDDFTQSFSKEEILARREAFGFPPESHILMTSSRLESKNGITDVIESLTNLPDNVCFVICGSGSLETELKQKVSTLGLTKRVVFLGFVNPNELPLIMNACDTFIRPSLSEGLGNAFLEAMVARLPVIATQVGGIPDFLYDAKRNPDKPTTGWAVDTHSPEQIVEVVTEIIQNPIGVVEVAETAHQLAISRYDWDVVAKEMKEKIFEPLWTQ